MNCFEKWIFNVDYDDPLPDYLWVTFNKRPIKSIITLLNVTAPNTIQTVLESSTENENQEDTEPASNDQIREMDSIVSAMEADVPTSCDLFSRPNTGKL